MEYFMITFIEHIIPEQFTVKAQEPLLVCVCASFCVRLLICVQMAAIGGRHVTSLTRFKTEKVGCETIYCVCTFEEDYFPNFFGRIFENAGV